MNSSKLTNTVHLLYKENLYLCLIFSKYKNIFSEDEINETTLDTVILMTDAKVNPLNLYLCIYVNFSDASSTHSSLLKT